MSKTWILADSSSNESEVGNFALCRLFLECSERSQEINDLLYVTNTIIGYMIVGKINSKSNLKKLNLILYSVKETENFYLQHFKNLESLGICDSKSEHFSQKDLDAFILNCLDKSYKTKVL